MGGVPLRQDMQEEETEDRRHAVEEQPEPAGVWDGLAAVSEHVIPGVHP